MKCETLIRPAIDFKTMWFNDVYSLGQRTELKSEFCLCLVCVCVYLLLLWFRAACCPKTIRTTDPLPHDGS